MNGEDKEDKEEEEEEEEEERPEDNERRRRRNDDSSRRRYGNDYDGNDGEGRFRSFEKVAQTYFGQLPK